MRKIISFLCRYLYFFVSSMSLLILAFFSPAKRALLAPICRIFGYREKPRYPCEITSKSLSSYLNESVATRILGPGGKDGGVSLLELLVINRIISHHRPDVVFEIGTFEGVTALNMAANSPPGAMIYTLDLPADQVNMTKLPIEKGDKVYVQKKQSGGSFLGSEYQKQIVQLWGDSASIDFKPYYHQVDLVFIDGSHSYEYTQSDTKQALNMLRKNKGIILWHDYGVWDGVTRALNELNRQAEFSGKLRHIEGTSLVIFSSMMS